MIRAVLVVVVALFLAVNYYLPKVPGYLADGLNPFSSCTSGPAAPGGTHALMSDAGTVLRAAVTRPPPDVEEIRSWLIGQAATAGAAWGTFEAALEGRPLAPSPVVAPSGVPASGPLLAARAATAAGFTGEALVVAVAVAGAESGYNTAAANPGSSARGLWQIMVSAHADKIAGMDILDPYVNGQVAFAVWREAGGWSPWVAHTSGAYRGFLDEARAAVGAVPGTGVVPASYTPPADCGTTVPAGMPSTACPASEARLTAETVRVCRTIIATFGRLPVGGWGTRPNPTEHDDGRALDFMTYTDTAKGQAIADYLQAHAAELDVLYLVWRQSIWSVARADEGWRRMPDRGSPTANHEDHVHASIEAGGVTT